MYQIRGSERFLVANLSSGVPSFSVSGLLPGSNYLGEIAGYNVKGVGVPITLRVYTLKLPEKLIPSIVKEPNPRELTKTNKNGVSIICVHSLGVPNLLSCILWGTLQTLTYSRNP